MIVLGCLDQEACNFNSSVNIMMELVYTNSIRSMIVLVIVYMMKMKMEWQYLSPNY